MSSSTSSGSATGNPRNKVALSPGHSLMDWIRLGNSGADLTGVGGKLQRVTEDELAKHDLPDNAWLVIRGNVYNVTRYRQFHPGGVEELMKGAGKDATSLFTEVHPWVNYESILQKCLVGRLVKKQAATEADLAAAFFDGLTPPSSSSVIKMCWSQTTQIINFRFNTLVSSPHVLVRNISSSGLIVILLRVRKKVHKYVFRPEASLEFPCRISTNPEAGQVEVQFSKVEEGCWKSYGKDEKLNENEDFEFFIGGQVMSVHPVTHNSVLMTFKFEDACFWIPIGHDIRLRVILNGKDFISRRYTPCTPPCASAPRTWSDMLTFLIKKYDDGELTSRLVDGQSVGQVIGIGAPNGDFDICDLKNVQRLYLIAAGTGITPMTRIISWGFLPTNNVSTITLLFLNRTEADIIWRKELSELVLEKPMFSVQYGLSQPSEQWLGLKGRLDETMLSQFLPSSVFKTDFLCVCGPKDFTLMVQEKLRATSWSDQMHCFLG